MKKLFVIVLSVLSIMLPVCAGSMKYDVNGYANSNGLNLVVGSDSAFTASLSLDAGLDMYFDGLNGMDLRLGVGFGNDAVVYGANLGYARQIPFGNGITLKLKTGLNYTGINDGFSLMGLYVSTDFSYPIYKGLYMSIGMRDTIYMIDPDGHFCFINQLMLPTVGIGYCF